MRNVLINAAAWTVMFLLLGSIILLRAFMVRRAVFQVIRIMRRRRSVCSEAAKTPDELGLAPPDFMARLSGPKDYKPQALDTLIRLGVVRVIGDGRVCLAEETLKSTAAGESG